MPKKYTLDRADVDTICQCLDDRIDQLRMEIRALEDLADPSRYELEGEEDFLEDLKGRLKC